MSQSYSNEPHVNKREFDRIVSLELWVIRSAPPPHVSRPAIERNYLLHHPKLIRDCL
jgi:hypothetical protein